MAVAHRLLRIAWHILHDGTVYRELGGDHFDRRHPERTARRLTQRLERLGYSVTLATEPASRPIRNGTTRWPSALRGGTARRFRSGPELPPASPALCPKCAAWGIPCLHAKNAKSPPTLSSNSFPVNASEEE